MAQDGKARRLHPEQPADRSADEEGLHAWSKDGKPHVNKDYVGRDASCLGRRRRAFECRRPRSCSSAKPRPIISFVQEEQMMPFVPFVRVKDVNEAMDLAIEAEHGYRHTAIIH